MTGRKVKIESKGGFEEDMIIESFEPIADRGCKVLILGTVPGGISLELGQYYANRRNQFWRLIYAVFDEIMENHYDRKKSFLLERGIGLWDVLHSCERKGSSDSKIRNPVPADFKGFFESHPGIRAVCFDSIMAQKYFKRFVNPDSYPPSMDFCRLPSPSPANTVSFNAKLEQWRAILLPLF